MRANYEKLKMYSTYSAEKEQVVGTWIDGKPIYRKVFTFTSTTSFATNINNIDNLIKMDCNIRYTGGASWRNLPWLYDVGNTSYIDGTWAGGFYFDNASTQIRFQMGSNLATIDKGILIMEYTKTTD